MLSHIDHLKHAKAYLETIPAPPNGAVVLYGYPWIACDRTPTIYGYGQFGWYVSKPWKTPKGRLSMSIRVPAAVSRALVGAGLHRSAMPRRRFFMHRIIAMCFIPNPNGWPQIRHLDGNPLNNAIENLAWGTAKQNSADRILHGTMYYGENHPSARLTNERVTEWRRRCLTDGESYNSVARDHGVSPGHVRECCLTSWKKLPYESMEQKEEARRRLIATEQRRPTLCRKLPPADELKRMAMNGMTFAEIARKFNASTESINIKLKRAGLPHRAKDYKEAA